MMQAKGDKQNAIERDVVFEVNEEDAAQPADKAENEQPVFKMAPSDELQIYYNDAYMGEKRRFNDMFGLLDEDIPAPEAKVYVKQEEPTVIYKEPDLSAYVPIKKHKKVKTIASVFVVLTIALAAALVCKFLGVF